ncbi:hypothetical protein NDU88_006305 [Pleurodeles waltl]|uniref:Uncharacterized protein n=1 Tax=Pleurodeles waltl TaxID=8319 RepID=A0AAV7PKG8_PLEWA|nr:hypothetical protein NDU88_006305 [Pleurodeles waltl]
MTHCVEVRSGRVGDRTERQAAHTVTPEESALERRQRPAPITQRVPTVAVLFKNPQDHGGEVEDRPRAVLCPVWRESGTAALACEALHSSLTHDALRWSEKGPGR